MRKENVPQTFVNIRDYIDPAKPNAPWKPYFFIGSEKFSTIGWLIKDVTIETKKITPATGKNAGKEITLHNLIVHMIDLEWEMSLQLDLYSQLARSVLNALAWPKSFEEDRFFSVYKNKMDYRTIAIKDGDTKESAFIQGKYTFQELLDMVEMKIDKWEEKKNYDWLMDKLITELMPIVKDKIQSVLPKGNVDENDESVPF